MNCLVTGGCGFIGSHLTELLLSNGANVTIIDNLSTGRLDNIAEFRDNARLKIIEADINSDIEANFKGIDYVFHLAALADIVPSIQMPDKYFRANVDGTFNVIECAKKNNVKKLLYAASSSCYGIPDNYPTPETEAISPKYPYALTKNMGEQLVMHWGDVYKLPVVALRLFNVYGTRSRTSGTYGAVFGVFLGQKISGKPYTVVGDGTQTRDFTYVTDVADAFYTAAISDISGEVLNVGSGNTYSVNELVNLLGGDVVYIPKRPGEPDCTFADTKKIQRMLNWKPKVNLSQGVAELLKHIDYWKNAPVWTTDSIKDATSDWFKYLDN